MGDDLRSGRSWRIWSIGALSAAGLGAGALLFGGASQHQALATSVAAVAPVPVVTVAAEEGPFPIYLRGIGTVVPISTVTVRTRVDGELTRIAFREGEEVKAGDVLAEVDPRPFEARVKQARGALAQHQSQLDTARRDFERSRELISPGYVTHQTYDTQKDQISTLEALLQTDQGVLDEANVQLAYCTIRSAISGRVGMRLTDQGNIVHATDPGGITVITQLRPTSVMFTLPQDVISAVQAAAATGPLEVEAWTADDKRRLDQGQFELIDNLVDAATGTIKIRAKFENEQEALWPGEFVNVRLILRREVRAVSVPTAAVQRGIDGAYVYVVRDDQKVEVRAVDLGGAENGKTWIRKGLSAGDRIVVDGQSKLRTGAIVAEAARSPSLKN
jgi:membrane fusion protein, multidrug efflux system